MSQRNWLDHKTPKDLITTIVPTAIAICNINPLIFIVSKFRALPNRWQR